MVIELTDKNYEQLIVKTDQPIFIDFYSPTCGPCQILMGYLPKIAEYATDKNVSIFKCDVSKNPKIANKYQIRSVPFTLVVTTDKKIDYVESGVKDIGYYIGLIDKFNPNKKSFFSKIFSIFK
jgi:thioredoxin 1